MCGGCKGRKGLCWSSRWGQRCPRTAWDGTRGTGAERWCDRVWGVVWPWRRAGGCLCCSVPFRELRALLSGFVIFPLGWGSSRALQPAASGFPHWHRGRKHSSSLWARSQPPPLRRVTSVMDGFLLGSGIALCKRFCAVLYFGVVFSLRNQIKTLLLPFFFFSPDKWVCSMLKQ